MDLLTIREVEKIVRYLDGGRHLEVSARQLRYWAEVLAIGAGRATDGRNAAHLFTAADVALVRLVRQLRHAGVPPRVVWALLIHHGEALRDACRHGCRVVLWIEPNGRAHVLTAGQAATKPRRECYALTLAVRGVKSAIHHLRAGDYRVWDGARSIPVGELAAV